mmetsp:Transcript_28261/g.70600  ORF Transcript_28261/g.70600 Transcript_28261/m.70600 type:complete len:94 (-) Transcript_28261:1161-1442(-)
MQTLTPQAAHRQTPTASQSLRIYKMAASPRTRTLPHSHTQTQSNCRSIRLQSVPRGIKKMSPIAREPDTPPSQHTLHNRHVHTRHDTNSSSPA